MQSDPKQFRRPFAVTLLAAGVLTIASLSLLRLGLTIDQFRYLPELKKALMVYQAVTGLVWAFGGSVAFWGLWRGTKWAPRWMGCLMVGYSAYVWIDLLWISNRQAALYNWRFTLGWTLLTLAFTFWTLARRASRRFFGQTNLSERSHPNGQLLSTKRHSSKNQKAT